MVKKIKRSKGQRSTSRSTMAAQKKGKGSGVEAFFRVNGLTPTLATKILDGDNSIPGHRPDKVRRMRESLKTFGWTPS